MATKQRNYAYGLSLKVARFGCARFGATRFGFLPRPLLCHVDLSTPITSSYDVDDIPTPDSEIGLRVFYAWQREPPVNTTWTRE